MNKKFIFSGIQPSGYITLGNYLGALKNWVLLQDEFDCCFSIVDLHAITVRQEPGELRMRALELLAQYIACGLDPQKCILFFQSHVSAHAELSWVLGCNIYMGELSRMTQFKEKSAKQGENVGSGLFTYPNLMAADILLYQADLVPVGQDQKQHLELTRTVAERFNHYYGKTFKVPEPYIPKVGAKIMDLQTPDKKMAKSETNKNGCIALLDDPDTIIKKFKKAVTDSEGMVCHKEGKDGINNLLNIYCAVTGKTIPEAEKQFEGTGYGGFKTAVAETVADELRPVQEKFSRLMADTEYLKSIYKEGAKKAEIIAQKTLADVFEKVGYIKKEV